MTSVAPATSAETITTPRPNDKVFSDGTHRVRSPQQTWDAYFPLAGRMGITRVANMTGLDWIGIPVYNAIRPTSRSLSVSQGKGATHIAAKVSAFMESAEYWHAEFLTLPLRHDSYRQLLREGAVVDVSDLAPRAGLDSFGPGPRETPARAHFRPDLPELWVHGVDLLRDAPMWTPYDTVRLNKVGIDYAETRFRVASTGLASGNTTAEATVHGICELIERDGLTLWWQSQHKADDHLATKLDLDTVTDPVCQRSIDAFQRADLEVAAWDVTSDTGVPAFQCCVVERPDRPVWRPFGPCWGYGCHPASDVALSRALTEAAQSRITVIAASRDDNFRTQYTAQNDARKMTAVRRVFFSAAGRLDFAARPSLAGASVAEDLRVLLDRLRTIGTSAVVAVDLTKPELGIPVVRVVIPGLEYFSLFIGYEPGRRSRSVQARAREQRS